MKNYYINKNESYAKDIALEDQNILSSVRAANTFLAKVILFFGLAVFISAVGTFVGFQYLAPLFLKNPATIWILFAIEMILVITSRAWSVKRPINYPLFALFAFITGLTVAPLIAGIVLEFGGPSIVIKTFFATTLSFSAAAIFGWTTNRNLSGLRGFLWISLIGILAVSIIGYFIPWSNTFEMIFSVFGIIVFGGYTMYDIQRLKSFPPDRYIDAAINIYLDIFNLFLFILRLVAGVERGK